MGPPGRISLVKWGPQGGLKVLVFWGSPSEIGPTHACWQSAMSVFLHKEKCILMVMTSSLRMVLERGGRSTKLQHIKIAIGASVDLVGRASWS